VQSAPADGYHTVSRGDTLYAIAWRYGLDYRDVASWNGIAEPYLIRPDDRLRLSPPPRPLQPLPPRADSAPAAAMRDTSRASSGADTMRTTAAPPGKTIVAHEPITTDAISWQWPADGQLLRLNTPTAEKGIRIGGRVGQVIKAAAPGKVVYSGSGLIGYGKLIIIKHNDTYLSAYAHNSELLVKEGDSVTGGQTIATMGAGNDGRALLHFEIRRNGKPIDPLTRLPKRPT
jgi:lipoprotein NlpD